MASDPEKALERAARAYRRREEALRESREELLEAMVAARGEELTLARIAEIVGMSRQRVMELLAREAKR